VGRRGYGSAADAFHHRLRIKKPDPNAAAALQELLGGKYGEMSTLGNYMFQSFTSGVSSPGPLFSMEMPVETSST
jgi:Mn-containing catalase